MFVRKDACKSPGYSKHASKRCFIFYLNPILPTFPPVLCVSSGEYPEFSCRRALRNSLFLSPRFLGWVTSRVFRISMGGVGDCRDPYRSNGYIIEVIQSLNQQQGMFQRLPWDDYLPYHGVFQFCAFQVHQ